MGGRRKWGLILVGFLVVAGVSSCGPAGSAPPRHPAEGPVAASEAWFAAIDAGTLHLALAHFTPKDRGRMEWSNFGTVKFSDVHCRQWRRKAASAVTICHFKEVGSATPQTFWTVSLRRRGDGRWLITNYGTG